MRIAFLNLATDSNWGGGEKWTLYTARGLADRGHSVLVLGRKNSRMVASARSKGLAAGSIPVGIDYSPKSILFCLRAMKHWKTDALIVHHNKDVRTGAVAAKLLRIPVLHRNGFPVLHNTWRHRLTHSLTKRILTNSENIRNQYLSFGWVRFDSVDVVPNGIQPIRSKYNRTSVIEEFGFPDNALICMYAGRFTSTKRVEDILFAANELPADSRWRFLLIGSGSQEERLKNLIEMLQLSDKVHLTGFREDAADLTGCADLVVLPSSEEGMPNQLMEAMIQKVPVAATPVGDVPFLLDNGSAGWLVSVGDIKSWASLFGHLETHSELLHEMGRTGKKHIDTYFSFEAMLNGIEKCLHKLTGTEMEKQTDNE